MNTTLLIMAAGIGSRFGTGIEQVIGDHIASICSSRRCWRTGGGYKADLFSDL